MKRTTKLLSVLILLALLLVPATPALAKGPFDGGPVIFGGNYTLESGETLDSDLVVFGGNVEIQEDAVITGSIVVFGGTITMNGTTGGDVVLFGGSGSLGKKAIVKGDLVTVGGSFLREEGSRVEGEVRSEPAIEIPAPGVPDVPETPAPPQVTINPLGSALQALIMAIVMGALAMLLVLFMHPQMDRVAQAAVSQPLVAGGAGLLVAFSIPVMMITLILIPVAMLAALGMMLAWVFGIVSLGMEVGDRFTRAINQNWPHTLSAGFGTFLMMLIVGGIGIVPCVGWIAPFLVGLVGVGAVVLAFLNARARRPSPPAPPSAPLPPEEPLPPAS